MQSSCSTHPQILCVLPSHSLLSLPPPAWIDGHYFLWEFQQWLSIRSPLTDALAIHDSAPCEASDLLNFLAVLSPLPRETFVSFFSVKSHPAHLSSLILYSTLSLSIPWHWSMSCQLLLLWGFYTSYFLSLNIFSVTSFLWTLSLEEFLLLWDCALICVQLLWSQQLMVYLAVSTSITEVINTWEGKSSKKWAENRTKLQLSSPFQTLSTKFICL